MQQIGRNLLTCYPLHQSAAGPTTIWWRWGRRVLIFIHLITIPLPTDLIWPSSVSPYAGLIKASPPFLCFQTCNPTNENGTIYFSNPNFDLDPPTLDQNELTKRQKKNEKKKSEKKGRKKRGEKRRNKKEKWKERRKKRKRKRYKKTRKKRREQNKIKKNKEEK